MNLVKMIQDQLSGDVLNKLSSVLGADPEATSSAASAAVPTLLGGLASLASSDDGVRKLTNTLSSFDAGSFGNFASMLGGDSGSLITKGSSLLGSLFSDSIITTAANAIGRFTGLSQGTIKSLLAMLMPTVLGKVASQWKSQGGTQSALTSLFADQKKHIADAVPAGFSLADMPGFGTATDAARLASRTTRRPVEVGAHSAPSLASWLLPLALLLAGAFLLWNFLRPEAPPVAAADEEVVETEEVTVMKPEFPAMPAIPTAANLTDELNAAFKNIGETFTSIKDAASAEAAAPKLEQLNTKIDDLKKMIAKLPESARSTLNTVVEKQLTPMKDQAQKALDLPGLSERIKSLINQIIRKLEEWNVIERAE